MKNPVIIGIGALVIIGSVLVINGKKDLPSTNTTNTQNSQSADMFANITDLCNVLSKEQIGTLLGKPVVKTVPLTTNTLHSCQYYLNDSQALIINNDHLNIEKQKKGHEILGRKIVTNPQIPMEHFLVVQENGLINEIYLVLGENNYLSINRTSGKTMSEDEVVSFATKLADLITGKTPLEKSSAQTNTTTPISAETKSTVSLPQETDIVQNFFTLIEEKKPSDAVSMMAITDDSQKQAWAVQFNAITSVKLLNVEPSMQEEWSNTQHTYKVTLDVKMNPDSANAPIPYYGWDNGQNIRWITLEKIGDMWKVQGIATGP